MSFDKLITDFEIQDYVDRYLDDIEVNEETIPEDVIREIGPGGEYLTADHTLNFMRVDTMIPHLSARGTETDPEAFYKNIDKRMQQLLNAYHKPELPAGMQGEMQALLRKRGIPEDIIARCTV